MYRLTAFHPFHLTKPSIPYISRLTAVYTSHSAAVHPHHIDGIGYFIYRFIAVITYIFCLSVVPYIYRLTAVHPCQAVVDYKLSLCQQAVYPNMLPCSCSKSFFLASSRFFCRLKTQAGKGMYFFHVTLARVFSSENGQSQGSGTQCCGSETI